MFVKLARRALVRARITATTATHKRGANLRAPSFALRFNSDVPTGNAAWADRDDVFANSRPYPHFQPTISGANFVASYSNLEKGARCPDTEVLLAGRIISKREASKKLFFYDVDCHGQRLQVMSPLQQYEQPQDGDEGSNSFRDVHLNLRRGDIIGIRGFPGKSNVGELSIIPRHIQLLSPCLNPLPEELKEVGPRFRQRHVDLLVNKENKDHLVARARVIRNMRQFFEDREFLEVETPILSDYSSGAMARPFTTQSVALVRIRSC